MTIDVGHLTPGPWHPLTISGGGGLLAASWAHPDGCPTRCRTGRILLAGHGNLPEPLQALPAGSYQLRSSDLGLEIQHADGTAVPGQPARLEPVPLDQAVADRYAELANEALNAFHHADQCGCDTWPTKCHSGYAPGYWDTGAWYAALPVLLAAFRAETSPARSQNPTAMTVANVDVLASNAHAGQVDKIGVPYIKHVRTVAAGLRPFGPDLQMAGLLHDVIEDTHWTGEQLRAAGVPNRVVGIVEDVTNIPGVPYEEKIRRIVSSREATLVKIADNAHNSRPDRAAQLPPEKRERLAAKYRAARGILWAAADSRDIEAILRIVNPALLPELAERTTRH